MGLLDLPAPVLDWMDGGMTVLPAFVRLLLWGAAGGAITMWLYRWMSPQQRIAESKREQIALRRRLDDFDGELGEAWPLLARLLRLSAGQLLWVLVPSVAASVPTLCLVIWISTVYGHVLPADGAPALKATPDAVEARWLGTGSASSRVQIGDAEHGSVEVEVAAPVTVIGRWRWWNAVVGNPGGYLPPQSPATRLDIALPERQCLRIGPLWMRGWVFPFFVSLVGVSLLLRRVLRIE